MTARKYARKYALNEKSVCLNCGDHIRYADPADDKYGWKRMGGPNKFGGEWTCDEPEVTPHMPGGSRSGVTETELLKMKFAKLMWQIFDAAELGSQPEEIASEALTQILGTVHWRSQIEAFESKYGPLI